MKKKQWLDEVLEINASTPNHPNSTMLIDRRDWLKLKRKYKITKAGTYSACKGHTKYDYIMVAPCVKIDVHVLLFPNSIMIDHKNRNGLDNTRKNLRPCTSRQNQRNRKLNKNNTSGVKGVLWESFRNKWKAQIRLDSITYNLGRYKTKKEAIKIRKIAERLYFGEFAYQGT